MRPTVAKRHVGWGWVDEIPAHWEVKPFRWVFEESSEVNGPKPVGAMLSVSGYRGVEPKEYEHESQMRSDDMLETYRVVRPGQLAVNTMWLNYAGLGVSEHLGHVSPAYRAYSFRIDAEKRFIHYMLRSRAYVDGYTANLRGIRPNSLQMDRQTLMSFPILLPPLAEQCAIADYLDRETAKIDTLIAKQQALIETLRERRAAVVESSVAALDWDTPIRSVCSLIQTGPFGSQLKSDEYVDGGTPVINPSHITEEGIRADPGVAVSSLKAVELSRHAFVAGDVVIARRGDLGRCAVVRSAESGFLCGTGSALLRPFPNRIRPEFLALAFRSRRNRDGLVMASVGATMDNLNADIVAGIKIPVPSLTEQDSILRTVSRSVRAIDQLISKVEQWISLSAERRTALVSAAVTGGIQIRKAS